MSAYSKYWYVQHTLLHTAYTVTCVQHILLHNSSMHQDARYRSVKLCEDTYMRARHASGSSGSSGSSTHICVLTQRHA